VRYSEDMNNGKKRTVILGIIFLAFLLLAYIENTSFFVYIRDSFANPPLAVILVFIHNLLAVSLTILGMSFYVEIVLTFMPKRKIEYVVLHNPTVFAAVFTVMILIISILRASTLMKGAVDIATLALVILISVPNALVEGYGIFQAIKRTLSKKLTLQGLGAIYLIFFAAAVVEVSFVQLLLWASVK
jgi:hypothetical protein